MIVMTANKKSPDVDQEAEGDAKSPLANSIEVPCRGEAAVDTTEAPSPAPPGKQIHSRRRLPRVPEKRRRTKGD